MDGESRPSQLGTLFFVYIDKMYVPRDGTLVDSEEWEGIKRVKLKILNNRDETSDRATKVPREGEKKPRKKATKKSQR